LVQVNFIFIIYYLTVISFKWNILTLNYLFIIINFKSNLSIPYFSIIKLSKPSFSFRSSQKRTTPNSLLEIHRTAPHHTKLDLTPGLGLTPDLDLTLNLDLIPDFDFDLVLSLICTSTLSSICHGWELVDALSGEFLQFYAIVGFGTLYFVLQHDF
jgi:hypothetical protein